MSDNLKHENIDGKIKFLRKEMEDLILEAVTSKLTKQVGKLNEMRSHWNVSLKKEAKNTAHYFKHFTEMKLEFIELRKEVLHAKFDAVGKMIQNKIDHSIGKGFKRLLYNILPAPFGDLLLTPKYLIHAKSELSNLKNDPRLTGQMSNSSSLDVLKELNLIEYDASHAGSSAKSKKVEQIAPVSSKQIPKKAQSTAKHEKALHPTQQKLIFSKWFNSAAPKLPSKNKRDLKVTDSGSRKKKKIS